MNVFVILRPDQIDSVLNTSLMLGNEPELLKLGQTLSRASNDIKDWAIGINGKPIFESPTLMVLSIPAERLTELADLKDKYQSLTNHTLSIGVGMDLRECSRALNYSISNGGDQLALFTEELDQALEHPEEQEGSLNIEELQDMAKAEASAPPEQEEEQSSSAETGEPQQEEQPQEASGQEQAPQQPAGDSGQSAQSAAPASGGEDDQQQSGDPRQQVMMALQEIKAAAPALEAMKDRNPQAYKAIADTIQAMILMAQNVVSKSEKKIKKEELSPSETPDEGSMTLDKDELEAQARGYPAGIPAIANNSGTQLKGKIKVTGQDKETGAALPSKWHSARAGVVVNQETGAPASSRRPNG